MFIALIKADAVSARVRTSTDGRDDAPATCPERPGAEVYAGIFHTWDDEEAYAQAAEKTGVDPGDIRLIQLVVG